MVICRFRLVPRISVSPSPSLHSHVITTKNFSSKASTSSRQCLAAPVPLHLPTSAHVFQRDLSSADGIRVSRNHLPGRLTQGTDQQLFTTSNQDKAKKKDDMDYSPTPAMLYARLNVPNFSKLSIQLSSQQVRDAAFRARRARHAYVLDNLSRNILDSPEAKRAELAATLLSIPHLPLDPSLTASLSSCIPLDRLFFIPVHTLSRIACILIDHPSPSNTETLLTRLVENITHRLELFRGNDHGPPSSDADSIPVWALFRLVIHLSKLRLREPATRVLQSLVEMAYIPPEAIQRIDQSSGDFHLIIVLTLVRSCISWNWNSRALALLRGYLGRKPSTGPVVNRLCQDVLYALMEFPTLDDLYLGVSFVEQILSSPEPIFVSPDIIRQIYSSAQRLRHPQIATRFYKFTQCKPTQSLHKHPLPSGPALTWFLRYLSNRADHLDIARGLVKQVADRCEPIPLEDRAVFIAIAAECGFARPARTLWERYSSGSDGRIVAGNGAMVVRLCSLFANLSRGKAAYKFEISGQEDSVVDGTPHDDTNDDSPQGEEAYESESSKLENSVVDGAPHDDTNDDSPQGKEAYESESSKLEDFDIDGGPHDNANEICTSSVEDEEDFRNFANLVLTRFREAKEPLLHASREDLNALARANIILGYNKEGLQVLQIVLDRKERPDLHDANVVLSAIASVDPRMALKMVRRMASQDPKPDGVSFGTIIHEAARHGDFDVIIGVLRLVQETGQQLTAKTMVSIIRASVAFSGADRDAVRDNLIYSLRVITANAHSNQLATRDMGRFCANEALKVDDPVLAFIFWNRIVQPRAEWDDNSHGALRSRIASSIRSHCKKGHIGAEEYDSMMHALKGWGKGG